MNKKKGSGSSDSGGVLAWPAARRAGPGCRRPGKLGHRCRRRCRYCGILFIAVICHMLYIILYLIQYDICLIFLLLDDIYHVW